MGDSSLESQVELTDIISVKMSDDYFPVPRAIAATSDRFHNNHSNANLPPRFLNQPSYNTSNDNYRHRVKAKDRKLPPRMAKHKYYDYEKKRLDHSGSENSAYQFKSNSMTHYQNQYQKSLSQNQNTHEQTHTYDVNISGYVTSFSYPVGTEFPQNLAEQIESISNYLELSTQVHFTQIGPGYTHSSAQIVHAVLNSSTKLYPCNLCQSYISIYAVLQPCNHATLCYPCGNLEKETKTEVIVSNDENNNKTSEFWLSKVDKVDENKIQKCLVCDEKVQTVQKVKHGSGSVYKCPAEGCYFSCQNSLTELLDHIKVAKHFKEPEEIKMRPRKVQNVIQQNGPVFQIPVQRPVQVPVQISVQKQSTIQYSDQINQNPQNTKNQLQNPFQDENGQMYYK